MSKREGIEAILRDRGMDTPAAEVIAAFEQAHPGESVTAQTVSRIRSAMRAGSNGLAARELSWKEGKRLEAIADEHGGMEKFSAVVAMVDEVAKEFGGLEGLKAALKEVQGEE